MPTDQPQRIALYARVSTSEQADGYSISAQTRAIRERFPGAVLVEYIDEGKSAATENIARRPAFVRMLADVDAGRVDVVAVHKLDRFSRRLLVTLQCFERLGKAGVAFQSISEQIDYSTPMGKLFLHMIGAVAQWYSDNLGQETSKGKTERRAQGMYNGHLPFGVVKGEDNLPAPDPATHAGLVLALQLSAEGQSATAIGRTLNARGYRTTAGGLFGKNAVRRILSNRFYVGELPDTKGGWLPGKHTPLVDVALFESSLAALTSRNLCAASHSTKPSGTVWALTGLLRCGHCEDRHGVGHPLTRMGIRREGTPNNPRARCRSREYGWACEQPAVSIVKLEPTVAEWLSGCVVSDVDIERVIAELRAEQTRPDDSEAERKQVKTYLGRLRDQYRWGHIPQAEYLSEYETAQARLRALAVQQTTPEDVRAVAGNLRRLRELWDVATPAERNELLGALVERVVVHGDRIERIVPRGVARRLVGEWVAE